VERDLDYENSVFEKEFKAAKYKLDGTSKDPRSPICRWCKQVYSMMARTCAAFPRGIPTEIHDGENIHTSPYPGDNGVLFDQLPMRLRACLLFQAAEVFQQIGDLLRGHIAK
jgi:hypothetical protein